MFFFFLNDASCVPQQVSLEKPVINKQGTACSLSRGGGRRMVANSAQSLCCCTRLSQRVHLDVSTGQRDRCPHLLSPQRDRHQLPGHVHQVEGPLGHLSVGLGGEVGGFICSLAHANHICNRSVAQKNELSQVNETLGYRNFRTIKALLFSDTTVATVMKIEGFRGGPSGF